MVRLYLKIIIIISIFLLSGCASEFNNNSYKKPYIDFSQFEGKNIDFGTTTLGQSLTEFLNIFIGGKKTDYQFQKLFLSGPFNILKSSTCPLSIGAQWSSSCTINIKFDSSQLTGIYFGNFQIQYLDNSNLKTSNLTTLNARSTISPSAKIYNGKIDITPISPYLITALDYNGDNLDDILVTTNNSDKIYVFLNYGNQGFNTTPDYQLDITANSHSQFVSYDINLDGIKDFVITTSPNIVEIFLSNGVGSYTKKTLTINSQATAITSISIGKIDNTSSLDFAFTYFDINTSKRFIDAYTFDGDTFTNFSNLDLGTIPWVSAKFLNLDNDTDDDLVAIIDDGTSRTIVPYEKDSTAFLVKGTTGLAVSQVYDFTFIDIDQDLLNNDLAILLNDGVQNSVHYYRRNTNALNSGLNLFDWYQSNNNTPSSPSQILAIDANNDTYQQEVIVLGRNDAYELDDPSNAIQYSHHPLSNNPITSLTTLNLNGDNNVDLAFTNFRANKILTYNLFPPFIGTGSTWFQGLTYFSANSIQTMNIGDFNNDGKADIILNLNNGNIKTLKLCSQASVFCDLQTTVNGTLFFIDIATADLNFDGKLDFVGVGNGNFIQFGFGDGLGGFNNITSIQETTSFQFNKLKLQDFNGDIYPDIVAIDSFNQETNIFFNQNGLNFSLKQKLTHANSPNYLEVADLNNDAISEILVSQGNSIDMIKYNPSLNTFTNTTLITYSQPIEYFQAKDINADSLVDIIILDPASVEFKVYLNQGNFNFAPQASQSIAVIGTSLQYFKFNDLNNNGYLDLVAYHPTENKISVWVYDNNSTSKYTFYDSFQTDVQSLQNFYFLDTNQNQKIDIIGFYQQGLITTYEGL
jgi:hypothetical protein